jgi:hypothetical protein
MDPQHLITLLDIDFNGKGHHYLQRAANEFTVNLFPERMLAVALNYRATEAKVFSDRYVEIFQKEFKSPEGTQPLQIFRDHRQVDVNEGKVDVITLSVHTKDPTENILLYEEAIQAEFVRVHQKIAAEIGEPQEHRRDGTPVADRGGFVDRTAAKDSGMEKP